MPTNASFRLFVRAVDWLIASFLLTLTATLWPHIAYAATITVDGAICTLPDAITAANSDTNFSGCTLVGAPGVDTLLLPPLTSLATASFNPNENGLTATPAVTSTVIIRGGVDGAIVERSGPAQYRLFFVASNGNLTLEHVTVRFGNSEIYGGAIHNVGTLTLLDSDIISNRAASGGGIYNDDGRVTITNTNIISNRAAEGGGIYNDDGRVTITNTNILSNTASEGGGFYNLDRGTVHLANGAFRGNVAGSEGGGFANHGTAILTDTVFISNTAGWFGGGFSNVGEFYDYIAMAIVSNSDFLSNTALSGGGLYASSTFGRALVTTELTNVNFIANVSTGTGDIILFGGGGLYNGGNSTATLSNTNFISNRAQSGGGIHNGADTMATIILTNSHVISNIADYGGGIYNVNMSAYGQDARITIADSEFRANRAIFNGGGIYQHHGEVSIVRSRLVDNWAGDTGGALLHFTGGVNPYNLTRIEQSCLVNNSHTAVTVLIFTYEGSVPIDSSPQVDVSHNWWGAVDGPTGAGAGHGDSIGSGVTYAPFLTSAILECPTTVTTKFYLPDVEQ